MLRLRILENVKATYGYAVSLQQLDKLDFYMPM